MSSADCTCCGQPTTASDPVGIEPECHHGCFDCTDCEACGYGECSEVEYVVPVVLCGSCDLGGDCGPGAWHCRCDRACDGSACPGGVRA